MNYLEEIIYTLIEQKVSDQERFRKVVSSIYAKSNVKGFDSNVKLREVYNALVAEGDIEPNETLEKLLITKRMRSLSGVSVITVLTKAYSCPGNCIYCPTEIDVPKSYLSNEPAVMRAILNKYDAYNQVKTRLDSLKLQGHPVDKIELIVIGGTFSYLPRDYQEEFIKRCFDALNGSNSKDLAEAKEKNEAAKSRCVGLTLETRPDYINEEEVKWFRFLGATRVELGVQSLDDKILELNRRGHKVAETKKATRLLKDAGFKICYHLMPNLYGSNVEKDKKLFREVFSNSDYRPDYIKIYPCMVTKNTPLFTLYKEGEYQSYTNEELIDVISDIKKNTPHWVRIMRTIRDIPATSIESGSITSNLRQVILKRAEEEGWQCRCIRCREVGSSVIPSEVEESRSLRSSRDDIKLYKEEYEASGGKEVFLSYETTDRKLFSLLRLRLTKCQFIEELKGCAIIREIHTYGQEMEIGEKGTSQHAGYGRKLIVKAEEIAKKAGYKKIAVISGVGVRDYYRKLGYNLTGEYMVKGL
ncbi:MAG: tRNA uridine(34) 5-carboxymethylaminomethyl modification radical SAM/GNAT enzyme Elp3 [Patescibacteria group bacterium]|nr:tRNA uridine(34) 5-carboxymethylaminomethyl modification radical SAM/GNAT enzyme Elp3 [Patescibacteria group bacterium]